MKLIGKSFEIVILPESDQTATRTRLLDTATEEWKECMIPLLRLAKM